MNNKDEKKPAPPVPNQFKDDPLAPGLGDLKEIINDDGKPDPQPAPEKPR